MKSRVGVVIFLCVLFAVANTSPVDNKAKLEKEVDHLDYSASLQSKSETGNDDSDDILRSKKSTTTTFCVEIKPGNDQPAVVICDPTKNDQLPIPPPPPPAPSPPPPPPPPAYPQQIPILIPEPQPQFEPVYEPLIVVPQPPQFLQPQLPQYFQPQPQIYLIRDSGCPSHNPTILPSPLQYGVAASPQLYASPQYARASGYDPTDELLQRSIPGLALNGLSTSGITSPLDLLYSIRGPAAQQTTSLTIPSLQSLNGNQNPAGVQPAQRPYVIQCNPTLTPLNNQQSYRNKVDNLPDQSTQQQYNSQPHSGRVGPPTGSQTDQSYVQPAPQRGSPNNNDGYNQYDNQHGTYPQNPQHQHHNTHHQKTGDFNNLGKSADGMQRELMNMQQQQQKLQMNGEGQFKSQGSQSGISSSGANFKSMTNPQDPQKAAGSGRLMEGNKNVGHLLNEGNSYGLMQGQRSSIPNKNFKNKDQGFNGSMQPQYRQQQIPANMDQRQFQQPSNSDLSYNQRRLEHMKSAAQGNILGQPPFMNIQQTNMAADKQNSPKQ